MPALVPDPVDGQGNGKDTEPKKDINILTYTVTSGRMAFMGSAIQGRHDPLQCRVL